MLQVLKTLVCVVAIAVTQGLPAWAASVPKCSDAQANIREQIDPAIKIEMNADLPNYENNYVYDVSKFYAVETTDSYRDCRATVTLTTNDGTVAGTEISYRVIATEDGQTLTQITTFQTRNLAAGLVSDMVRKAQAGMNQQQLNNFYAPQGPGSSAARAREWNRERGQ